MSISIVIFYLFLSTAFCAPVETNTASTGATDTAFYTTGTISGTTDTAPDATGTAPDITGTIINTNDTTEGNDTATGTANSMNDYGYFNPRFSNAYGQQQDLPLPQSYGGIYNSYHQGPSAYPSNAYLRDTWLGNGIGQGYGGGGGVPPYGGGYYGFPGGPAPFYGYYSRSGFNGFGGGGFPNNFMGNHPPGFNGFGGSFGPPALPGMNGYGGDANSFGAFEPTPPYAPPFGPRFFPPQTRGRQIYPLEPEDEFERAQEPMFRPVGTISQQLTPTNYGYSYVGYIRRQAKLYPIMIYTLASCSACHAAKHMMTASYADIRSHFLELAGNDEWQRQMQVDLQKISGSMMFPYVFICGAYIGGFPELVNLHTSGQLRHMLTMCSAQRSLIRSKTN